MQISAFRGRSVGLCRVSHISCITRTRVRTGLMGNPTQPYTPPARRRRGNRSEATLPRATNRHDHVLQPRGRARHRIGQGAPTLRAKPPTGRSKFLTFEARTAPPMNFIRARIELRGWSVLSLQTGEAT
jgi:hypothetical protein